MAQLQRSQSQKSAETAKTSHTIHTMEQLLRAGEASRSKNSSTLTSSASTNSSSLSSPFFQRSRHHESEEEHGQNQKKSVLTKVKEKAKKLRNSLSKKRHEDGNVSSPSSATGVAESDGVEEESEYLGAPTYESEKVPTGYQANERRHSSPRGNPIAPEKHVSSSRDKHVVEQDQEKSLTRSLSKKITTQPATTTKTTTTTSPNATTTNAALAAAAAAASTSTITSTASSSPKKPIPEIFAKKLAPIHIEAQDAAPSITSKTQGLTASKPTQHHDHTPPTIVKTTRNTALSYGAPRTPPAKVPSYAFSKSARTASSTPVTPSPSSAPPALSGKNTSPTAQIWDKGVSMKEYLMNKFEPGEDEKALSQVISEAMSPRRTPGDAGVMEKVREAVTSLLRTEEPTKHSDTTANTTTSTPTSTPTSATSLASSPLSPSAYAFRAKSHMPAFTNTSRASSQMPTSTNASRASSSQIPTVTNTSSASSSQIPIVTNTSRSSSSPVAASINASRASSSQIPTLTNTSHASSSQMSASPKVARTSPQIPVSYNAQEDYTVTEEENHGRILQAN